MKKVIFDMETGDPDDLITLLLLLLNREVNLTGITCYQGSSIQIGLIKHVLSLARRDIPIGGNNEAEPLTLSPYYTKNVGVWEGASASMSPVELFDKYYTPDTLLLTGAPLTNIAQVLNSGVKINHITVQGGFLGELATVTLDKFKKKKNCRTYNLSQDVAAFDTVNYSTSINDLTFVTKDLCHGFLYNKTIHNTIDFGQSAIHQLLKKCLSHYADMNSAKAMHDPLAMLYMLYPDIGQRVGVSMSYNINSEKHSYFSSIENDSAFTHGLIHYDAQKAWSYFKALCE